MTTELERYYEHHAACHQEIHAAVCPKPPMPAYRWRCVNCSTVNANTGQHPSWCSKCGWGEVSGNGLPNRTVGEDERPRSD